MMFFTVKIQFPESKQDAWQNVKRERTERRAEELHLISLPSP